MQKGGGIEQYIEYQLSGGDGYAPFSEEVEGYTQVIGLYTVSGKETNKP